MNEGPASIKLCIRKEPQADESAETEKGSRFVLTLTDDGGVEVKAFLPPTLQLEEGQGDYKTYRKFFLEQRSRDARFSAIGMHLHALLHEGEVGEKWKELLGKTKSLRILLDTETSSDNNENLALLPWELIFDGKHRPFQETNATIVRVHNYQDEAASHIEEINWPIRLLIVVGVNDPTIAAADEIEKIEDALRKVNRLIDVEVMKSPPNINELQEKCVSFKPHIFHYIGHGGVDGNNPYILLRGSNSDDPWRASQIQTTLPAWRWVPRFVFINACRTFGGATTDDQNGAWGVSDAFQSLQVPAVLTMQANIDGKLAGVFAGTLYERLAAGDCIDRAVVAARIDLRENTATSDKENTRDWATPTLTISIPPEKILPFQVKATAQRQAEIRACAKFKEVSILANRKLNRRQFIYGFSPIPPQKADKELVLVHGPKESGKTWVTLWCLEACAWQNHNVRYVEVVSGASPKWLDVLRQIQAGDASKAAGDLYPLIYRPLARKAFWKFNHDLQHRLKNGPPPPWDGRETPYEENLDLKQLDNLSEDTVKNIFTTFREALLEAAEPNNPLIIVLDRWSAEDGGRVSPGHMENFLIPHLFAKAAGGGLKSPDGTRSVKLVLVMNEKELKEIYPEVLNKLTGHLYEVHFKGMPAADFDDVAREYIRNLRATYESFQELEEAEQETYINTFRRYITPGWQPSVLGRLQGAIEHVLQQAKNP